MLGLLLVASVLFGLMSYVNMDPMKSSFFLIGSMLMVMPLMSYVGSVWFSYFVSLLFLSGIFVILVYFSSLSKFGDNKVYLVLLGLILTVLFFMFDMKWLKVGVGLNVFYYKIYWYLLLYIFFVLLGFMNFTSYFLSFSGALRKV
uniref:NADH dehydrogenase subunit 6 n=1 Tax=Nippostrongylus brasiliensis TaxID=27835 RepID=A0A1E1GIQ9_NIPBR|nr:NADH dehydrogenase subunit 6 [Nippostrongylus brasiliensis]APU89582.1 NADH dehydrogenase subunit 6 [Nippostrongylus brasiliensis]BAV82759.1 NADH dehydrogenase subunit 6 [Nippostrongylus brasiliensis]